jgi:hypothetical protein
MLGWCGFGAGCGAKLVENSNFPGENKTSDKVKTDEK